MSRKEQFDRFRRTGRPQILSYIFVKNADFYLVRDFNNLEINVM